MTDFEKVIHRSEAWLEKIDRDRDAGMRAKPVHHSDAWTLWMDRLDAERRDTVALIEDLRKLQHRRPLLFRVRPTHLAMLKVPLGRRLPHRKEAS